MKVLEEQCTHTYRPHVKKKVVHVVPAIVVQKTSKKDGKRGNKLKNHVLAKQMAKKLAKKDRATSRNTASRASKISTISEEH